MERIKTISKNHLRPDLRIEDVDIYLPRGIKALEHAGADPRGFFRIFQRYEGARFFGREEFLDGLMSIIKNELLKLKMSLPEIRSYVNWFITIYSVPEGYALNRHETAMTLEGPGKLLLPNETPLAYLSVGTRYRTLAARYKDKPWVFMGARYLLPEELAICMRALSKKGILGTVPKYSEPVIGTESHSQETLAGGYRLSNKEEEIIEKYSKGNRIFFNEGLAATIRATIAFANANPGVPVYALGDYVCRSIGCADTFIAVIKACEELGIKVAGGRIDISKKDLNDIPIIDYGYLKNILNRTKQTIEAVLEKAGEYISGAKYPVVQFIRKKLDEAGYRDFKLVASSGVKLDDIDVFAEKGAALTGIGEDAAYHLNKGECNFTSDCVGYWKKDGVFWPMAKEGRELWRAMSDEKWAEIAFQKVKNIKIHESLEKVDLIKYLS